MGKLYQQYYTKSNEIVSYMIHNLKLEPNSTVLEPCAGDGVFIDALLNLDINLEIDAFELDNREVEKLNNKYNGTNNLNIRNADTLLYKPFIDGINSIKYDYIIANPPYGAWQEYEKRDELKNIYPNLYIKETYSTFLYLCLSLLKEDGRLVFITPDTYLNLHRHTFLRKYLLTNSLIEEISIFPSSFFPGVNFGYSKLSVITLKKTSNFNLIKNNHIVIRENFKKASDLNLFDSKCITNKMLNQIDVLENIDHAFFLSDDLYLNDLLKNSNCRVSDIAYCVTGIYSGNDKEYIKVKNHSIKNGKNYQIVADYEKYNENDPPPLEGIDNERSYIPLIKGGNIRYYKDNLWFINWSKSAIFHYKTNKKARFQNSQFYFKNGIGVPMVSSNKVTASLVNNRLFDQSIVGIFSKEEKYLYYLLAFFNSSICTKLLRLINPSANNSANYIKKIPLVIPDNNVLYKINKMVLFILDSVKNNNNYEKIENELDDIFEEIYLENYNMNIPQVVQKDLFA